MSGANPDAILTGTPPRFGRLSIALREHLPLLALVAVYCLAGYGAQWLLRLPDKMGNVWFHTTFLVYPILAVLSLPFALAAHRWTIRDDQGRWIRGAEGWRRAAFGRATGFITAERMANIAVAVIIRHHQHHIGSGLGGDGKGNEGHGNRDRSETEAKRGGHACHVAHRIFRRKNSGRPVKFTNPACERCRLVWRCDRSMGTPPFDVSRAWVRSAANLSFIR